MKKVRNLLLAGILILVGGYQFVQAQVGRPEVLDFIESQASQWLIAKVKVERIQYLPPFQLALEGIQIEPSAFRRAFTIGRIRRLVLGYGLLNLLRWDFKVPSNIRLDSPEIRFDSANNPFPFLSSNSGSPRIFPGKLVIQKGLFRYPGGDSKQEMVLSKVRLKAMPDAGGKIHLELSSEIEGMIKGKIEARGVTNPSFNHYGFEVHVRDVAFLPEAKVPLQNLDGRLKVSDQLVEIESLTTLFHEWEVKGNGKIENWQVAPKVSIDFSNKRGNAPFRFLLQMDFEKKLMTGEWSWINQTYPFEGEVVREKNKILFSKLKLPNDYRGQGEFDVASRDYHVSFERERRRFRIHSNLNHLSFETEFRLDHAAINHLDCVALGRVHIYPLPKESGDKSLRFKAEVKTDYFILEFQPLQDLAGNFEFDSGGISEMSFRWGEIFSLEGRILFKGKDSRQDLTLRVEGFPLEEIHEFAGRPVPKNLTGRLEGKLKAKGEIHHPEIQGYFTIKDGTMNKLDFDRAVIQFRGFPPYLRLYDSKIFRGRSTLNMIGAIDLTLKNYLHGIQIKGPDHLVIWKGMSAYWKEGESAVEAERPLMNKVAMGLEVGAGVSNSNGDDREESHAVIGPKVRF